MKSNFKKIKEQDEETSVKPLDALTLFNTALIAGMIVTAGKTENSDETGEKEDENYSLNENVNILNMMFKRNLFDTLCKFEVMNREIENLQNKIKELEARLEKNEKNKM